MFHRRVLMIGALAAAAVSQMFGGAQVVPKQGVKRTDGSTKIGRQIVSATGGYIRRPRRTVAQDKRDARKRRNQLRHKRACRG